MSLMISFILILLALVIGEIVSIKTKAIIPSVFITAVIFLVGYWTIFPADILNKAGFSTNIIYLSMYFLIVHMGTMLSVKELIAQWKTFSISILGICGICFGTLVLGKLFFSWDMLLVATPPLTGGVVASIIMSQAATAKGMPTLAVLAVGMYVMQGFAGYPLTAITLNMEGKKLIEKFRAGDIKKIKKEDEQKEEKKLIPPLPKRYQTTYMFLFQLGILAQLSIFIAEITNKVVSEFVICLIVGAIAAEIGLIERKPLNLSGSFGFFMTGLMAFIFGGLAQATPDMIKSLIIPFIGIIGLGVIGLVIFSIIGAKIFNESIPMAIAISLNALYGFPVNYTLTNDSAKALGKTDEEVEFLLEAMLPKMLIGGFASVTIVSVVIAGIFAKML
ncbi:MULTISPECIES: hypothetical protein [Fusobacterium]|uniref:hypothetical protein n=1 Tax=Fusobacterium TaxID=848 RepID=UPI00147751ED|nr:MULTISPECIES: hypothetical protein [Fusobacterium]NME36032.1 hypothetical protein [Fusobacterium sp. FSA-380-WT-3A]